MARRVRVLFPGAIYHVYFRGTARKPIFTRDGDRHRFLKSLRERVFDYEIRLYLYCLMFNHGHLLVEPPCANLPEFMESLLTSYAVYFNLSHGQVGHLTQGRYGARLVEGNEYLLRLSRYIHLNPVFTNCWRRRPLAERLERLRRYQWSSYPAYAGLVAPDEFVDYGPILAMVGGSPTAFRGGERDCGRAACSGGRRCQRRSLSVCFRRRRTQQRSARPERRRKSLSSSNVSSNHYGIIDDSLPKSLQATPVSAGLEVLSRRPGVPEL